MQRSFKPLKSEKKIHKLNKREKTDYLKKNKPLISNIGGQRTMECHFPRVKLSVRWECKIKTFLDT